MVDRYKTRTYNLTTRYLRETDTGELERFLDSIDLEFALWNGRLDEIERFRDMDQVPDEELVYKIANLGGDIPLFFPPETRRAWVGNFVRLQRQKGDHANIVNAIRLVLGITVLIDTFWNDDNSWTMDAGYVGETTYVGGGDWVPLMEDAPLVGESFYVDDVKVGEIGSNIHLPRTFVVKSGAPLTDVQIEVIKYIIYRYKPAEEHWILVTPDIKEQWQLGFGILGTDTVLHGGCWKVSEGLTGITTTICGDPVPYPDVVVDSDDALSPPAPDESEQVILYVCSGTYTGYELTPSQTVSLFYG